MLLFDEKGYKSDLFLYSSLILCDTLCQRPGVHLDSFTSISSSLRLLFIVHHSFMLSPLALFEKQSFLTLFISINLFREERLTVCDPYVLV